MIYKHFVIMLSVLWLGSAFAEVSIYDIDNKVEAAFPHMPQLTGELGEGQQKYRSYSFTDEKNLIVFTVTYQVGKLYYKKGDIIAALKSHVDGQAISVGGNVVDFLIKTINNEKSSIYVVKYKYQGLPVVKHGVVTYKNGSFYQWTVQEFPSISTLSGKEIFQQYLSSFLVK
jgi:hypothetical protein